MSIDVDPHPRDEPTTIELAPPTEYVLIDVLERLLQDDSALDGMSEKAAAARLLSSLEGRGTSKGELTEAVSENTVLDGLPGHLYQEQLFEHYETVMIDKYDRHCPSCHHRFDLGMDRDLNCPKCGIESHPASDCKRLDCSIPPQEGDD